MRARADGWTPEQQADFIGYLAETRSVKTASSRLGMSGESAYRLRGKPGANSFAEPWDGIMGGRLAAVAGEPNLPPGLAPSKVTLEALFRRIAAGRYRPVMRGGRYAGTLHSPDITALLAALARLDRMVSGPGGKGR